MKSKTTKILLLFIILAAIGSFYLLDLHYYLNLDVLKLQKDSLDNYYSQNRTTAILGFVSLYILMTALSLPGATILTLLGGAIFGFSMGLLLVSFASTIGATLAFLSSRFLLREAVQEKFSEKLKSINKGLKDEGSFYLLTLRLMPIFPFFMINLIMGLTQFSALRFFIVSQIGMLPGTAVYVNAGTQLAQIDSLQGIVSPKLLLSFAALGIFPLFVKKAVDHLRKIRK